MRRQLAYGENRYQGPAYLKSNGGNGDPLSMFAFLEVSGDPGYISIADTDQILDILCILAEAFRRWKNKVPHIVIVGKHGNPCGTGIHWENPATAISRALSGNPVAVVGGKL